jgi:peroxiredoxin
MERFAPLLIGLLVVLAAGGGVVLGLSIGAPVPEESRVAENAGRLDSGGAQPSAPTATIPSKPSARGGRVLKLDEAMHELDLIRPSRQKLAEDFTLATSDGKSFRLSDHRGKTVLVNFWATWCPPCREEMPAMERLYRQHKDQGLVLVAVSLDADPQVVTPYLRESKLTFAVALDPKMEVANKYGVRALPSSFIVDRQGAMAALALGPRHWDNAASHSLVEALTR